MGITQLDYLLEYLYNNRRYQFIAEIHENFIKVNPMPIIDVLTLLNKLVADKNVTAEEHTITSKDATTGEIKEVTHPDSYVISFEGILFKENGGYIEKNRRDAIAVQATGDQNQRMERNEVLLVTWTRRLAIATLIAAGFLIIWDALKVFCFHK
jgi:hypothetical protein